MPVPVTSQHSSPAAARERGSALILVAAIALFVGFLLTLGIGSFSTQDMQDRIDLTAKKQKFLISELAAYAQRENRIPCPADPSVNPATAAYGFARGANWTANPLDAGACGAAGGSAEGIVPFRTLGLSAYDALDSWGRLMTYRVSPVLTNPALGTTPADANIFMRCRRYPWFDDGISVYSNPYVNTTNVYPDKALFCCSPSNNSNPITSDLKIFSSSAAAGPINNIGRSINADYATMNTISPGGFDPIPTADGTQEVFAFAIISHGGNGVGAFIAGSTTRLTGSAGTDEQVNFGTDVTRAVDHPIILAPGPNYFDDMVVWRTQIGLMS